MIQASLLVRALRLGVPLGLLLAAFALSNTTDRLEAYSRSPFPIASTRPFTPAMELLPSSATDVVDADRLQAHPVELVLSPGQTLDTLLGKLGMGAEESRAVVAAFGQHCDLRRLRPGDALGAHLRADSPPDGFELVLASKGRVRVSPDVWGSWQGRFEPFEERREARAVTGEVDGSLAQAVSAAGAPAALAYQMAEVLQWDLDFNRDLRAGDRFEVLFEEVYLDGELTGVGHVLAMRYENRGQVLEAYRYPEDGTYYGAEGRPLRKMFLRSPLPFTRVTSRFSARRFHPVLKVYRPHYGVDYGAPTGTPVRATARGTVISAGRSGGAGNMVKVRHAGGYVSAYLHLSRFAQVARPGARVAQGDVVGYVGSTGLATAPHLDYRVQKDGRWLDPLGLKSVQGEALDSSQLAGFMAWRDRFRARLAGEAEPDEIEVGGDLVLAVREGAQSSAGVGAATAGG